MKKRPRQSVSLLSNNRKYLSIVCHKGFNNDYTAIKKWLTDLYNNRNILLGLLQSSRDGANICYGIIGTAISCRDQQISLQAAQLLHLIRLSLGMNWDWFLNEGINTFIYIITKNDKNKLVLLKILFDFIQEDVDTFFDELKKKLETDKHTIFEFLSSVLPFVNKLDKIFCDN